MLNKNDLIPPVSNIFFIVVFMFISFFDGQRLLSDCDTGYHIRAGEFIMNSMSVPKYDIFSYISPPLPWTVHEWLSEVIMATVHEFFGLTGIVIFFALMIALLLSLLLKVMKSHKKDILISVFITAFVVVISRIHWLARPHIFSLLLFLLWYYVLDSYQNRGKNYLYVLPAVMLLWVNLHGSFIIAFVMTGIYFFANVIKMLASEKNGKVIWWNKAKWLGLVMIICLVVSFVNPYGYKILSFPFQLMSSTFIMNNVSEFISSPLYRLIPFTYFLYLLITIFAVSKLRLNIIEALLIVLFTHMALYSVRFVPLFAIISAPIVLKHVDKLFIETQWKPVMFLKNISNRVAVIDAGSKGNIWPIVAFIAVFIFCSNGTIKYSFDSKIKPIQAIEFLNTEKLPGNMFNHREFGDYIIYALWPQYHVFADGRSDMYGEERLKEYFKVERIEPGWREVLNKYEINWIIHETNSMLSTFLLEREDWKIIYADKVASIFVRNTPENQYIINKYANVEETAKKLSTTR